MIADDLTQSNRSLSESVEERAKISTIRQVDFYKNPTILSRLILNEKYASALKRLKNYPDEASTWVCSKRNPFKGKDIQSYIKRSQSSRRSLSSAQSIRRLNSKLDPKLLDYSIRQLPIHVACSSLFRASSAQRADLELLITHLAVMNPDGCQQPDHEGKFPLHEAVWHNASPETISVLLMASPSMLHERDKYGRSPLELNRYRSGENKEQIKDMFHRGVAYWESARTEALMHTNKGTTGDEEGSILRSISKRLERGGGDSDYDLVEPVTWKKLETRAKYLEQLLSSAYEKNYELGELVDSLSNEKMQLQDELNRLEYASGLMRSAIDLSEEIDYLNKEISLLQEQLKEKEQPTSHRAEFDLDTIRYLEWRNSTLQAELNEMTERNRENELKVDRLEIVVSSLQKTLKAGKSKRDNQAQSANIVAKQVDTTWEDFMELLETLTAQSPLAMERFLSGKIIDLEEQLADLIRTAALDHAASTEENKRLMRENEALQREVSNLSARQLLPPGRDTVRSLQGRTSDTPSKKTKNVRRRIKPQSNPHQTDSLDEILRQAAWMYGSEFGEFEEGGHASSESMSLDVGKNFDDDMFPFDVVRNDKELKAIPTENVAKSRTLKLAPVNALSNMDTAWNLEVIKQLDAVKLQPELAPATAVPLPSASGTAAAAADSNMNTTWISELFYEHDTRKRGSISNPHFQDSTKTKTRVSYEQQRPADVVEAQLSYFNSSDPKFSESLNVSDLSDSRSWRVFSASKQDESLRKIPTEIIVALRTASFSTTNVSNIEKIIEEADSVRSTPIPDNIKSLIRERYRKEGADLSKLLLAWLSENLGERDSSNLSADDLNTIFAGADQLGAGQTPSPITELASMPTPTESSDGNAPVTAFREMAGVVSARRLSSSPPSAESSSVDPKLVSGNMSEIFNEAARDYSRPILGMEPDARLSQKDEVSYGNSLDIRARTRNAPTTKKKAMDEQSRGYKLK